MIYFVRTVKMTGSKAEDWDKAWELTIGMRDYWRQCPEVKTAEIATNITGRIDVVRFVLTFDSLADEEKWSLRIMEDGGYIKLMGESAGLFDVPTDSLYRIVP